MKIDNRYCVGSSGAELPEDRAAYYSARWIDSGYGRADIVPDRQGFAYDTEYDRDDLIVRLGRADPASPEMLWTAGRDETFLLVDDPEFQVWVRRCAGYVYVDAWLTRQAQPSTESTAQCPNAFASSETSTATPTS